MFDIRDMDAYAADAALCNARMRGVNPPSPRRRKGTVTRAMGLSAVLRSIIAGNITVSSIAADIKLSDTGTRSRIRVAESLGLTQRTQMQGCENTHRVTDAGVKFLRDHEAEG